MINKMPQTGNRIGPPTSSPNLLQVVSVWCVVCLWPSQKSCHENDTQTLPLQDGCCVRDCLCCASLNRISGSVFSHKFYFYPVTSGTHSYSARTPSATPRPRQPQPQQQSIPVQVQHQHPVLQPQPPRISLYFFEIDYVRINLCSRYLCRSNFIFEVI